MRPSDDRLLGVAFGLDEHEAAARWAEEVRRMELRWRVTIDDEHGEEVCEVYGRGCPDTLLTVTKRPDGVVVVANMTD
jgi:hypothetical protein